MIYKYIKNKGDKMTTANAKWELEILLQHKYALVKEGRDLDYTDQHRLETLRGYIDSIKEDHSSESQRPLSSPSGELL
jgi:hypothetical protein